jgi:hypothetical protein
MVGRPQCAAGCTASTGGCTPSTACARLDLGGHHSRFDLGGCPVLVAPVLGGTGLVMNARYVSSLGGSGEGATVLALVGLSVNVLGRWRSRWWVARCGGVGHRLLAMVP